MKDRKKIVNNNIIKYLFALVALIFIITSCGSSNANSKTDKKYSTLKFDKISSDNDSTEYEILIIDPGYDSFLATQKPANFYSQKYYENWNKYYVVDWNQKVQSSIYHSSRYQSVFEMMIDYNPHIDYGMEVNYKLYYYFMFVEKRYGVRFKVPRAINY